MAFSIRSSLIRARPDLGLSASAWSDFISQPAALALRAIQKYDEVAGSALDAQHRYLLIEAETELGRLLGLDCSGEPGSWTREGVVTAYDHDGDTCPVHEWLVESDQKEVTRAVQDGG
jgi:hypothetical protein